jgi:hypothetical protein
VGLCRGSFMAMMEGPNLHNGIYGMLVGHAIGRPVITDAF